MGLCTQNPFSFITEWKTKNLFKIKETDFAGYFLKNASASKNIKKNYGQALQGWNRN